ncbi:ribose import ATP-binding protein RbsA 2 [Catellatospora methionotrophica]|uniref:Ribose import ATP-binding protein RbsA 2 n=1 Tax=Catellatospora methionotrophica TaxID=121620 RepID=A0A8J3LG07_9ACTN|nr:sugar ABC transporter ATP-binding protein [Catellatospora methionotrophica]GIG14859.1 ribose import ATP-binding protein RbsA 2 [Catellatospora methionotrophica]
MPAESPVLLHVDRLTVEFPGVRALDGVHFDVRAGEVHALVGENGAGKSTLLKVLGGLHRPAAGEIRLGERRYRPRRPADALHAGIAVIYQEFNLYPDLTVAENVFSGREPYHRLTRGIDYAELNRRTAQLFGTLGVHLDPARTVGSLTVSEQQLVEIAKALSVDGRIIVMDEPTAALSADEVTRLLDVVRRLRAEGRGVVYVSHRLDEVFAVADRVTVLRDGRHVHTGDLAETSQEDLVRLMVGRDVSAATRRTGAVRDDVVLDLDQVSAGRQLREVSLRVRAGEIVGIGGVAGAGQPELSQVVFGALGVDTGAMTLDGRTYRPSTPADAMAAGVGFLHEDRKSSGILPDLSVRDNLTVSVLHRVRAALTRLLSPAAQTAVFAEHRQRLAIRATGPGQLIGQLSGGNQQKVLFGRALAPGGRLLVLNEPTRGVDIGAKMEIHQLIDEVTAAGTAVLMISSDLPELLGVSDRVYVLAAGRIVGHLTGDDRTEENVIACATTGRRVFSEVAA